MSVGFSSFVEAFPEFREAPKTLVDAKLAEARLQVDPVVWRGKTDLGVSYLAAHLVAISPFGQHARLQPASAKVTRDEALTTYERHYRALVRSVSSGYRVVCT